MEAVPRKQRIVILGGGFGGITAAVLLDNYIKKMPELGRKIEVVLVNNHHSHLYTPALYEIAALPQGEHALQYVKSSISIPLVDIFNGRNIEWLERTVIRIDVTNRLIEFENTQTLGFDYLILALGAETSYFNIPGLKEYSLPIKTFGDAVKLRDKVEHAIESGSPVQIVIGGAGATGVEIATEFENFICMVGERMNKNPSCAAHITLVEGSPEILPGFHSAIIQEARRRLGELGVSIMTNTLVISVDGTKIALKDGTTLPYSIFVWAGGVEAAGVLKTLGLPLSKKGGLIVDQFLSAAPGIYAVGDNAAFTDAGSGKPLPWNVPVAEAEAKTAVINIIAEIKKTPRHAFSPHKRYPFVLALGRTHAAADLVYIRIHGFLAWVVKLCIELRYLLLILPWWQAFSVWWRYVNVSRSNDIRLPRRLGQPLR